MNLCSENRGSERKLENRHSKIDLQIQTGMRRANCQDMKTRLKRFQEMRLTSSRRPSSRRRSTQRALSSAERYQVVGRSGVPGKKAKPKMAMMKVRMASMTGKSGVSEELGAAFVRGKLTEKPAPSGESVTSVHVVLNADLHEATEHGSGVGAASEDGGSLAELPVH